MDGIFQYIYNLFFGGNDNEGSGLVGGCCQYFVKTLISLIVGISQILIGAVTVSLLLYSTHTGFKDPHILVSMIGYFLSVEAILTANVASGWGAQLKVNHRQYAHAVLQVCGILCTILGGILASKQFGLSHSAHCISGFLAIGMSLVGIITGPLALTLKWPLKIFHIAFLMPAFVVCSSCIITGLYKYSLKIWFGDTVTWVLIIFVSFYTFSVAIMSSVKISVLIMTNVLMMKLASMIEYSGYGGYGGGVDDDEDDDD